MNYFVTGGNGATSVVDTNVTNSTLLTGLSIYTTYTIFVRAMTVVYGNSTLVDVSTDEGSEFLVIILYSVYHVEYVVFVCNVLLDYCICIDILTTHMEGYQIMFLI